MEAQGIRRGYRQAGGEGIARGSLWFNKIRMYISKSKLADLSPSLPAGKVTDQKAPLPEISSGGSVRSQRAGGSGYGREEQSCDARMLGPFWFHLQILRDTRQMALTPGAPEFCGCSLGPGQHLSFPLSPQSSLGQGSPCRPAAISSPGPLGAAVLPAMKLPERGRDGRNILMLQDETAAVLDH